MTHHAKPIGNEYADFYLMGNNKSTETKILKRGRYRLIYQASCFSTYNCCSNINLYINNKLFKTYRTQVASGQSGLTYYATCAGSDVLDLSRDAEVYLNISNGSYNPYAIVALYKIF